MTHTAPLTPLGVDLRQLRKARGLTLTQLAQEINCSVGWLSQVERNLSTPEPEHLTDFAKALDVSPESLCPITADHTETGLIVRKHARRPIGNRHAGLTEELLSPDLTDDFEVIHSTFAPHSRLKNERSRPTHELGFILSGQLDLWIEDTHFILNAEDSFRICGQSYRWANPYAAPCTALWVISPPVY